MFIHRFGGVGFFDGGLGTGLVDLALFLIFWAAIAVLVVVIVRALRHGPHPVGRPGPSFGAPRGDDQAVTILRERFARGDISEEEFSRRLALLRDR